MTLEEVLQLFHISLVCVGSHIFSKNYWESKLALIHQTFNFIIAILTFIFTSGFVLFGATNVVEWIQGVCIWLTGVITMISLPVLSLFRKEFRSFLEEMAFKDSMLEMPFIDHVVNNSYKGRLKELKELVEDSQKKLLKYTSLLLKFYTLSVSSTVFLYICDAIFQMIVREDDSMRVLAFEMWFPFTLNNFNVYIAVFIFHVYAGFLCCLSYPSLQSTIVLLMSQTIRQLHILMFILLHLDEMVLQITRERDHRWQENCTAILSQCVDHYVKIKRFSNRLNIICRPFYLALILDATMLVCVCSVKIAMTYKLSPELIKYYMHEFFFILMILLFCLLGQRVQNECEKLEQAVTEKWYLFDRKHKANIKIFMIAINRRMPIYIFGTITLSLPTFTWFIKTGMSFFTLAMQVLEG